MPHHIRNKVIRLGQAEVAGQLLVAEDGFAAAADHTHPAFRQVGFPELPLTRGLPPIDEDTQLGVLRQA